MDAQSISELASWLYQAVSEEQLHLSILPMPSTGGKDVKFFNRAYTFWRNHWADRMNYQASPQAVSSSLRSAVQHNDIFLTADKIVLISTSREITAIGTLHYLDLDNIAHQDTAALSPLGAEWTTMHRKEGVRTVVYGTNLVGNPASHLSGPPSVLGRLYIVTMLRNFVDSGLDMALCRMRRKTKMDKHGEFVGGRKEREVRLPGMGEEAVDVMTATQDIAAAFPYKALGPGFGRFWDERTASWDQVLALSGESHL